MTVFVQDPAEYLKRQNIQLSGWLDSTHAAILDSAHCSFVNYEAFFFADKTNKESFDKQIVAHVPRLTDPISLIQFKPESGAPHMKYKGRDYYFSADSTYRAFRHSPEMYALPNYQMRALDSLSM